MADQKTMKRWLWLFAPLLLVVGLIGYGAGTPAHAKDPCFFSDPEWRQWKTEKNGNPGWGGTLSHVQSLSGCQGTWAGGADGWGTHNVTWRAWAQSDGQQVRIGFADYYPDSPRFKAHGEAGIVSVDGTHFVQEIFE